MWNEVWAGERVCKKGINVVDEERCGVIEDEELIDLVRMRVSCSAAAGFEPVDDNSERKNGAFSGFFGASVGFERSFNC